jgi:hypothetical protein
MRRRPALQEKLAIRTARGWAVSSTSHPQNKPKTGARRTSKSGAGARSCLSLIAASAPAQCALGVVAAAAAALSDGLGEGEREKSNEKAGEALRAAPMSVVREICDAPPGPSQGKVLGVPSCARLSTQRQHLDNLLLRACSIKEETERLCLRRARDQRGPWACEGGRVKQKEPLAQYTLRRVVEVRVAVVPLHEALHRVRADPAVVPLHRRQRRHLFLPWLDSVIPPLEGDVPVDMWQSSVPGGGIHAVNLERKVALGIGFKKTTPAVPDKTTSLAGEHALHSVGAVGAATAAGDNERGLGTLVPTLDVHSASLLTEDVTQRDCSAGRGRMRADSSRGASQRGKQASCKATKRPVTSRSAVTSRGDSLDFFACTFGPILDEPAGLGTGSDQDCAVGSALHHRGLVTRQRCATTFLASSLDGVVCPTPPHRRCRGCASPNGTQRESPTLSFILIV